VDNSRRVHRALLSLGIVTGHDADSFSRPGVQAPLKRFHYADVLTPATAGPTFDEVADATLGAKLFGFPVRVPTIAMLIRLKEFALEAASTERDKHLADIAILRQREVEG
jgi:hypothetical protein